MNEDETRPLGQCSHKCLEAAKLVAHKQPVLLIHNAFSKRSRARKQDNTRYSSEKYDHRNGYFKNMATSLAKYYALITDFGQGQQMNF